MTPNYLSWETVRTGAATIVDQAIVSGTSFCLSVIIARREPKEELGLYVLGLSIVLFIIGIENSLVTVPYVFRSPRLGGKTNARYAGSTLIHVCGLSLIAIISLVGAAAIARHRGGIPGLGNILWALASVIAFILLREYARRVSFAWQAPGKALVIDLLAAVIQVGGLLLLFRMDLLSAAAAFGVTGVAFCLAALWWLRSNRRNFEVRYGSVISDLELNWSFGKWIAAGSVVYTARSNLYPWFLATLHGTGATATFAACVGVILFANPFFIAMGNVIGPKAAHNLADGGIVSLRRAVRKTTLLVSVFMAGFTICICVVGARLITLVYGDQYAGGGPIVYVLVVSLLATSISLGVDAALYAMDRPESIFYANCFGMGVTVLFGFWMAKYYGPLGAAWGLLAAAIVTSTSKYISYSRLVVVTAAKETARALAGLGSLGAESVQIAHGGNES